MQLIATIHLAALAAADRAAALLARVAEGPARRDERGQASAEYALVLLGAAAVALLLAAWATRTNRISKLLDAVFDQLLARVR